MEQEDPEHVYKAPAEGAALDSEEQTATKVGRYHCISDKRHGNLCVTTDAVSFEMHLTANQKWRVRYEDLKSVQKVSYAIITTIRRKGLALKLAITEDTDIASPLRSSAPTQSLLGTIFSLWPWMAESTGCRP